MEERQPLLYEERRILSLYRQMLRKEYDVEEKIIYENSEELLSHIEMQKAIYLAYSLLWTKEYSFTWSLYGPKSKDLEKKIERLDKNKLNIKDFYSHFDSNIYSHDTMLKLNEFYDYVKLIKLDKFIKLTSDIVEEKNGIELLADLCFIENNLFPKAMFEIVNQELQKLRPNFSNNELNRFAWKCLEEYELINIQNKSYGKVKRLE